MVTSSFAKHGFIEIIPTVQTYDWGVRGSKSIVADLAQAPRDGGYEVSESTHYAELWMGTHPNGRATIAGTQPAVTLHEMLRIEGQHWLNASGSIAASDMSNVLNEQDPTEQLLKKSGQNPNVDSKLLACERQHDDARQEQGRGQHRSSDTDDIIARDIPYLLKVLSVGQALSIQAHPHKSLARQLHASCPDKYKDPNHKPEIAIPLGPFEALCAFRRKQEIQTFVSGVPELRAVVGDATDVVQEGIKPVYTRLMKGDAEFVGEQVHRLCTRLRTAKEDGNLVSAAFLPEELVNLILELELNYARDVGIFSVFFLNYVRVDKPHHYIFSAPNVPHAYLKGNCVECMAQSDNVVRAGLTPKFKDVDLLVDMLDYRDDLLDELVREGQNITTEATDDSFSSSAEHNADRNSARQIFLFQPPAEIPDFKVLEIIGEGEVHVEHAAILLILSEGGEMTISSSQPSIDSTVSKMNGVEKSSQTVRKGQCFFLRAGTFATCAKGIHAFIATSND